MHNLNYNRQVSLLQGESIGLLVCLIYYILVLRWIYLQNIILKLTANTMRREKNSTGVARSKFIDRIKSSAEFEVDHKENVNLNDIRQSGYKLPRSKSTTRNDHSLERKQPIKIKKDVLNSSVQLEAAESTIKNTFKAYTSEAPTINNTIKMDTFHHASFSEEKDLDQHSQEEYSGIFNNTQLKKEEEALEMIRMIWECTSKMKEQCLFREEMIRIQNILKEVIIVMAKPKFKSIQENSDLSLKIAQTRFSPFQNLKSFKQSNQSSINCPSHSKQNQWGRCNNTYFQSQVQDDLEFKKIMYILEEKSKMAKLAPDIRSGLQEERELREINDILNVKTSCYSSSFDCSSREPSGHTVREFEKVSNSRTNDKVFLKNIVKKARVSASNIEEVDRTNFQNKSKSSLSCCNNEDEQISYGAISQVESEQQSILEHSQPHPQSIYENQASLELKRQGNRADPIKIETLDTLQDESESKRAVLNQIITMLNNKYHKNIKLEPRKF